MYFKIWHPQFPAYTFKLLQTTQEIEDEINMVNPVKIVAGTYDWPLRYYSFRGWTDRINSLVWPRSADNFSTLVLLIDDARNDTLQLLIEAQKSNTSSWHWPYVILSCVMQPNRGLIDGKTDDGTPSHYRWPAETFPQGGQVTGVTVDTERVAWKLYPLQPLNLTSLPSTQQYRGLWLLPLVDERYFHRNVPLNPNPAGSSSSAGGSGCKLGYPIIEIDTTQPPNWMPSVLSYPLDAAAPANYSPIPNNGTWPTINGSMRFGRAADLQAVMDNTRVVNRDVRSAFTVPGGGGTPHVNFTGQVTDYPEDWSLVTPKSYHIDACNYQSQKQTRRMYGGGACDTRSLDELTARKLQFSFRVEGTDAFYYVVIAANVDFPVTTADLIEIPAGPTPDETHIIPLVDLGVQATTRSPLQAEHDQLVAAAKQWALLYYSWRHQQSYMVFPDIYPLIPNGHAQVIRWDFGGEQGEWGTTYISLEGIQGTDDYYSVQRTPFYVQIDGEGSLQDSLHGVYAWTELEDKNGQLTNTLANPRRGFVLNVNGQPKTVNPARDEYGKVAVPVGLIVWLKPGVPYLDVGSCTLFDHYLFTTSDLVQIVRLKMTFETNRFGHPGIIIQRWNPDLHGFVDSKDAWGVILR